MQNLREFIIPQKANSEAESYRGREKDDKRSIVSPSDAIINPLAMVIAAVHTVVALRRSQLPPHQR